MKSKPQFKFSVPSIFAVAVVMILMTQSACNPLVSNSHIDSGFTQTQTPATPTPSPLGATLSVAQAVLNGDGNAVVVQLNSNGFGPILPAASITGFTVKVNGVAASLASATRTGDFEVTLSLQNLAGSDQTVEVAYASGNITDSSTLADPLQTASAITLSNNALYDSDVQAYIAQVATSAGTLTTLTKQSVQTLVTSLKTSGVWSKMIELYPFAGDQLAAALVKLKVGPAAPNTLANLNFTSANYVETGATGGLKGNGTSTRLDSGLSIQGLTQTSISMGAYVIADSTTAQALNCYMGSSYNATGNSDRFYLLGTGSSGETGQAGLGFLYPGSLANGTGLRLLNYDGSAFNVYQGTTAFNYGASGVTWQQSGTVYLFNCAGNFPSDTRLGFGFVGTALTSSQESALYSAIQAFEVALSRNI